MRVYDVTPENFRCRPDAEVVVDTNVWFDVLAPMAGLALTASRERRQTAYLRVICESADLGILRRTPLNFPELANLLEKYSARVYLGLGRDDELDLKRARREHPDWRHDLIGQIRAVWTQICAWTTPSPHGIDFGDASIQQTLAVLEGSRLDPYDALLLKATAPGSKMITVLTSDSDFLTAPVQYEVWSADVQLLKKARADGLIE